MIAPSLLAADFGNLERDVKMLNQSQCDWLHLDIMDGVFVPNISFGFPVLESIAHAATKPLDVHLMIENPLKFLSQIQALGARVMTVHQEACPHLHRVLQSIHEAGMLAGVALNPATSLSTIEEVLCDIDVILLMSVNPGFGGQKFILQALSKIRRLSQMLQSAGSSALIEVDGGINSNNAAELFQCGADVLVAGSAVFKSSDPAAEIIALKQA